MAMTRVVRVRKPGGIEQFEIADVELPPLAADEIQIRQTAIGVNFVDVYQRTGLYPMPPANIPGVEGVGVVAGVGPNVTSISVGDRVAYAGAPVGAYASERNLPAGRAIRLPSRGLRRTCRCTGSIRSVPARRYWFTAQPVGSVSF
jgi:NADPH2:quinone reductase